MDVVRTYRAISRSLRRDEKARLSWALRAFMSLGGFKGSPGVVQHRAAQAVARFFPRSMPADTDRLAFFLVASLMAALQATPAVGSDVTPKQLDAVIDSWRGAQDSLSDMGQEGSLRIQLAMERMSSFAATLSSMMKKMSETQAGIVANMK